MLIVLAILLGLGLAVLLLPVLIALRVEHPGPSGAVGLQLSWGFLVGGAGLQLRFQGATWYLHPLLLGRHLPFPRLRLGAEPGGEEAVPPPAPGPAPKSELAPAAAPGPGPVPQPALRPQPQSGAGPAPEAERPPAAAPPPAPKPPRQARLRLAGELVRPALRLLRRLGQTFHLRRLRLEGSFGLADPAVTGQLFGYLQGVRGLLPRRLRLELNPDFVHQGVRGTAHLAVHFYLGKALYLVACFGARLAWRWWGLRQVARRRQPL